MTLHPDVERVALIGWHLYPSSSTSKHACFSGASAQASCDLDQLELWSKKFPNCNWRVKCGPSRIWGLDLDTPETHASDGVKAFSQIVAVNSPLPVRPTLRSGGGGLAIFFRHIDEKIIGDTNFPEPGIDPRRGAQSQTIPPSIHPVTHKPYRWLIAPWTIAPPLAPHWLLELFKPPPEPEYKPPPIDTTTAARAAVFKAYTAVLVAPAGARNDTLNRRAYQLGRIMADGLIGEQEAFETLYSAAMAAGLDHAEAKATIQSGLRAGHR